MSLFIRVDEPERPSRVLNFRGLSTRIGLNERGIVSPSAIVTPLFAVHSMGEKYLLVTEADGLVADGTPATQGSFLLINDSTAVRWSTLSFSFYPTSSLSELLSRVNELSIEDINETRSSILARLEISLAGVSRSWPLPLNVPVNMGCSPADPIQLDFEGLAPSQYTLFNMGHEIIVTADSGFFRMAGAGNRVKKARICFSSELELIPSGLFVRLALPVTP